MKQHLKRAFILVVAVISLGIGLVGLVLPVLQGWFFILLGLLLLSMYSPRVRAFVDRHTTRYPHLHKFVVRAEGWVVRVFGAPEE